MKAFCKEVHPWNKFVIPDPCLACKKVCWVAVVMQVTLWKDWLCKLSGINWLRRCNDGNQVPKKRSISCHSTLFLCSLKKDLAVTYTHNALQLMWLNKHKYLFYLTVEPVYNGPVLSGHPLLSGQFSKSWFFAHTNAIFVTCIRRPVLVKSLSTRLFSFYGPQHIDSFQF